MSQILKVNNMNSFDIFLYSIGKFSVHAQEFLTPKVNWIIPFAIGMIVYRFIA